jgi:hypothetical protein
MPLSQLAEEVRDLGWIVYGARSAQGDWDLFACRPDGSERAPAYAHAGVQRVLSPGLATGSACCIAASHAMRSLITTGTASRALVIANADGTSPQAFGGGRVPLGQLESGWTTDCQPLDQRSRFDRCGHETGETPAFAQGFLSTDDLVSRRPSGWSESQILTDRLEHCSNECSTGMAEAVNRVDCCTPDWFPDSQNVIFSWRPPGQTVNKGYGWTQLWRADAEGKTRQLVYGEDGRHVYGGCVSPDSNYVIFTGNMQEDGDPGNAGAPMGLMRLSDAPIIGGKAKSFAHSTRALNNGPVLELPAGWEPCWTFDCWRAFPQPAASESKASSASESASQGIPRVWRPKFARMAG